MEPAIPETIPHTSVPEPKAQKSHGMTILAMALFVLSSLAMIAFLYYQNQTLKKMLAAYQSQPSPTPVLTPTPNVTPTVTEIPPATASASASAKPTGQTKACTQEAKLCPDGSYVGRTGPNCEFAPCP